MDQSLVWNLGQDFSTRSQVVYPPACAAVPGAVLVLNAARQMTCVSPRFLPEGKKEVPPCGPGWVPLLDPVATTGSGWSCVPLGSAAPTRSKSSLLIPLALAGAAVGGVFLWAMRS